MNRIKHYLALLLFPVLLLAGNFEIEQLSLNDGIAHSSVYAIYQDSREYIWFGTMFGLVKYDGYNYTTFRHNPENEYSIANDDIIYITEDSAGNIWCGTYGGGFSILEQSTGKFTNYTPVNLGLTESWDGMAWSLCISETGEIYVGTTNSGVIKYSLENNQAQILKPESAGKYRDGQISYIFESEIGEIFAFGSDGSIFSIFHDKIVTYDSDELIRITDVILSPDNRFIISGNSSLYTFNSQTGTLSERSIINSATKDTVHPGKTALTPAGNLWIATREYLYLVDSTYSILSAIPKKNKKHPDAILSGAPLVKIYSDNSDALWVSGYGNGLTKIYPKPEAFEGFDSGQLETKGFKSGKIWSMLAQDDKFWFGTSAGLGSYQNGEINRFGNKEIPIMDISRLSSNELLLASGNQVLSYNISQNSIDMYLKGKFSTNVNKIEVISTTHHLFGTENGLYEYKSGNITRWETKTDSTDGILGNSIISLNTDTHGRYWVGTYMGITIFNPADSSYKYLAKGRENSFKLPNNYLFSFCQVGKNVFLLGTAGGLVIFNEEQNSLIFFTEQDGLPNSVIAGIEKTESPDTYLLSTHAGISLFNVTSKTLENFTVNDGLTNNLFNKSALAKLDNNTFAAGGMNGLDIIDLDKLTPENHTKQDTQQPRITELNTEGRTNNAFQEELILNNDENSFTIYFNSFKYASPKNNVYYFRLSGADKRFRKVKGENFASYSGLKHGKYTFELSDNIKSPDSFRISDSIAIVIQPPFYAQWWFLSGIGLLLTGFIYVGHNEHLSKKMKEIERTNKIREAESNRVRKKAATDFHDELGHKITKISLYSELLRRNGGDLADDTKIYLSKIGDLSAGLSSGVRDFIWNLDPEKDTLADLYIRLKDFGDELFDSTDITFEAKGIDADFDSVKLGMDLRRHLTLLCKESMTNIVKHSEAGIAVLSIEYNSGKISIVISDDGTGFEFNKMTEGTGLKSMQNRADKLGGTLDINSLPSGTKIIFTCSAE
ncbi:MAG: hypothetical protein SCALA702_37140 [Melioribacteraceae bacterium]|nr:MAG: hypothetical protein SCALA702_37140 [Melioribacteraceae bacterium]